MVAYKISLMNISRDLLPICGKRPFGKTYCDGYIIVDSYSRAMGIQKAFWEKGWFEMFPTIQRSVSSVDVADKKTVAYFLNPISKYNYRDGAYIRFDDDFGKGFACLNAFKTCEELFWLKIEADL